MSVVNPTPVQERQNRKLLEQLEEEKKRLRMKQAKTAGQSLSASSLPSAISASSVILPATNIQSTAPEPQQMTAAQRAALQHAHANSVGYFITQESAFGNLILPVLPRFDK